MKTLTIASGSCYSLTRIDAEGIADGSRESRSDFRWRLHVRHVSALALGIFPIDGDFAATLADRRRALRQRLESDSDPIVRSAAAIALGRIGAEASVAALEEAREKDSSRDVRHQREHLRRGRPGRSDAWVRRRSRCGRNQRWPRLLNIHSYRLPAA